MSVAELFELPSSELSATWEVKALELDAGCPTEPFRALLGSRERVTLPLDAFAVHAYMVQGDLKASARTSPQAIRILLAQAL